MKKPTARTVREVVAAAVLTLVVSVPALVVTVQAQTPPPGFPDLPAALKATAGCLGVETARTAGGKMVVFAWFENKKAALAWYYSDVHLRVMNQFSSGKRRPAGPLADVPDDGRPILAIASLTMSATPPANGDYRFAVSQIAIELYAPLPGGLAAGGRFAPSTVNVPGLIDTPLTATAAAQ